MKRVTFGKFAGVKIKGRVPMEMDSDLNGVVTHAERAAWLTAMVESDGKYGCVMNYDGTGITAGIHQAIAVYPRALQEKGSLWELLGDIRSVLETHPLSQGALDFISLQEEFVEDGFEFCVDGYLRNRASGRRATGQRVRELLTGSRDGVMPESGAMRKNAEKYVWHFHCLFSAPETFNAQNQYGMKHFSRWSRRKMRFSRKYRDWSIDDFIYRRLALGASFLQVGNDIGAPLDLAMCMLWSHTVNAPGMALKVFCRAADQFSRVLKGSRFEDEDEEIFAELLIEKLGNAKYGRWDDDMKNGRYQRTRRYASLIWSDGLFKGPSAVMPKNLQG